MKKYVKNKKTGAISCIPNGIVGDYIGTGEWTLSTEDAYKKQQDFVVDDVPKEKKKNVLDKEKI